jgi:hypothetical protein
MKLVQITMPSKFDEKLMQEDEKTSAFLAFTVPQGVKSVHEGRWVARSAF